MSEPLTTTPVGTLRITAIGESRGIAPEIVHVRFVTTGEVDTTELAAALRAIEEETCSVVDYDASRGVGCYALTDATPVVVVGQIVAVPGIAPLSVDLKRQAYAAGTLSRPKDDKEYDANDYWKAWWHYQAGHPVDERRLDDHARAFHQGYYGHPLKQ